MHITIGTIWSTDKNRSDLRRVSSARSDFRVTWTSVRMAHADNTMHTPQAQVPKYKMIKFVLLITLAISVDNFASQVSSFKVDRNLLRKLKRIEGYKRLYDIEVVNTEHRPFKDAVKDYFLYHQIDLQVWDLRRAEFRVRVFERPCSQLDQLYREGRPYFDTLPQMDIDLDKNLMCKIRTILRHCDTYLAGDFIEDLHKQIVQHHNESGEGIVGQWIKAGFGGESSYRGRKTNSSRTRIRQPGLGRRDLSPDPIL